MGARVCGALAVFTVVAVLGAAPVNKQEDAVLEATLKGLIGEFLTDDVRSTGGVACLQIDAGHGPQSVSQEFLKRFNQLACVRLGTDCEGRPDGAVELATRAPAFILTAGPIMWVSADEAHVSVTYFRTNMCSGTRLYRVVRENSGWVSLGQIIKIAPA